MSKEQIEAVYKTGWDRAKKVGEDPFQQDYMKNVVNNFATGELPIKLSDVKTFVSVGHGKISIQRPNLIFFCIIIYFSNNLRIQSWAHCSMKLY